MEDTAEHEKFEKEGRVWLRAALSASELNHIRLSCPANTRPGTRHPNSTPLAQLLNRLEFVARLREIWPGMFPVRIVSFNKTTGHNWGVPWHQDRTIAVNRRAELQGFGNWSRKQGQWHCEPPEEILRRMLFVRVHLDPNTVDNGAMEIAVGSHKAGLVRATDADRIANRFEHETTTAAAGDVLVLNMLTLHRSPPSEANTSRRAVRVDFSAEDLPAPVAWAG